MKKHTNTHKPNNTLLLGIIFNYIFWGFIFTFSIFLIGMGVGYIFGEPKWYSIVFILSGIIGLLLSYKVIQYNFNLQRGVDSGANLATFWGFVALIVPGILILLGRRKE